MLPRCSPSQLWHRTSVTGPSSALQQPPSTRCSAQIRLHSGSAHGKEAFPLHLHRQYPEHQNDFSLFGDLACFTSPKDPVIYTRARAYLNGERHTVTAGPWGDIFSLTASTEGCIFYGKRSKDVNESPRCSLPWSTGVFYWAIWALLQCKQHY